MLFGLKHAAGTVQRAMDDPLTKVKSQFTLVYLDNIGILSLTPDEQIDHARQFLTLLNEMVMTLNLKKSEFFTNRIDYTGHDIRPGGLETSISTIDAICRLKYPSIVTGIRSVSGLFNILHRLVPNFASFAATLNENLQKGQPQAYDKLMDNEITAFGTLKAGVEEFT